jgi:hypothetical protein
MAFYIKRPTGWTTVKKFYVKKTDGTTSEWTEVQNAFIKRASGWKSFLESFTITPSVQPQMISNGSTTDYYGGFNLSLNRGTWIGNPTIFTMRIQRSINQSSGFANVATGNYTNLNSNSSTNITYALTDQDAKSGYYFRGYVKAEDGDGNFYQHYTPTVLSRISFAIGAISTTNTTENGATFTWTLVGVPDNTFYYSQQITITRVSDSVVVYQAPLTPGTTSTSVSTTNIVAATDYVTTISVIANDGWKTSESPTVKNSQVSWKSKTDVPVNLIVPTIGPFNNRGNISETTSIVSTTGTWSGVDASTIYQYQFYSGSAVLRSFSSSNSYAYQTGNAGAVGYVQVRASNDNGLNYSLPAESSRKLIDPPVTASITSGQSSISLQNGRPIINYSINNYPTGYEIDWGDGEKSVFTDITISSINTFIRKPTAYATPGTKIVTLSAFPAGSSSTSTFNVNISPFSYYITSVRPETPQVTQSLSTTENRVVFDWEDSATPQDINSYLYNPSGNQPSVSWTQYVWGAGLLGGYPSESSPLVAPISSINNYNLNSTPNYPTGPWDDWWGINSSANNSPISMKVQSTASQRIARIVWDKQNALDLLSFKVNYTITNAPGRNGTYEYTSWFTPGSFYSNIAAYWFDIGSLPSDSAVVTVNFVTGYEGSNGAGASHNAYLTAGFSSSTTASLLSVMSNISTGYYTYISTPPPTPTGTLSVSNITSSQCTATFTVSNAGSWDVRGSYIGGAFFLSSVNPSSPVTVTNLPSGANGVTIVLNMWTGANQTGTLYQVSTSINVPAGSSAPSTPTGLINTYSSGPSWTGSWNASTGAEPITYYWTLYQSAEIGGTINATESGSTTSTSFTKSMSVNNGLWAYYTVYASNSIGSSGTATSEWA